MDELSVHCIPYSPSMPERNREKIRLTTTDECKLQWLLLLIQL